MTWAFFWGMVTGVGIIFVGALFWVVFYNALSSGVSKQLNKGTQEHE
jgi:hypothetical protein